MECVALSRTIMFRFVRSISTSQRLWTRRIFPRAVPRLRPVLFGTLVTSGCLALRSAYPVRVSKEDDDGDMKLSKRQQRFRDFASVEYNGNEFMTPQDFLDSLIMDEPRERVYRHVLNDTQVHKILKATPRLRKGSAKLFRDLGQNGLISYAEYVFLLTLLTKSQSSFNIAFLMFDDDDNNQIDRNEFLKIRSLAVNVTPDEGDDCDITPSFTGEPNPLISLPAWIPRILNELMTIKRYSRSADADCTILTTSPSDQTHDTTIVAHLFGQSGSRSLSLDEFQIFYANLQRELIEIEFQEFARGNTAISAVDFARLVLRYSTVDKSDQSPYIRRVYERSQIGEAGVGIVEFEQFSRFLNNLEEFTKAVNLYTAADLPVSRSEFIRAVRCSTGLELHPNLVDVLFRIFDTDGDDRLSYSEFIAIMNDRLHRGLKTHSGRSALLGWRPFRDCVVQEMGIGS